MENPENTAEIASGYKHAYPQVLISCFLMIFHGVTAMLGGFLSVFLFRVFRGFLLSEIVCR